jgi:crotonobetainyl-CoA:carnitine CoA-transferase CaiB-like acyl-CoA transferase
MTTPEEASGPLSGLRVLELADEKGQFCGKLMADLGADVIKIEPPGGESTRSVGPFLDDIPHPDRSLSFWHYNTSKRGVTINLERKDGQDLFRRLASTADIVLETLTPGYLASINLAYEELKNGNPKLIMCSLTPFGQSGPWRDYQSTDMLHMAAGGQMASCGYDDSDLPDAPPIAPGGGNAWHTGAHYAYIGIMAALIYRTVTGHGQYIDASVHDACALTTESAVATYIYRGDVVIRQTGRHHSTAPTPRSQFRAKDGKYVNAGTGGRDNPAWVRRIAEWMDSHGLADDLMEERYLDPEFVRKNTNHIVDEVIANFIANRTADEVYHEAQERGFPWGVVRTPEDLLNDPHLDHREFWTEVEHPELDRSFIYPGNGSIFNGTPWHISRRAPLVGEHNDEVFIEILGLSPEEIVRLSDDGMI